MIFPVLEDLAQQFPGITREQDKLPTPCDDFDVSTLHRHLQGLPSTFGFAAAAHPHRGRAR
ncbi:hypothetical protein [Streptomyces sp. NPDC005209]|uniref:hypothetical protein n=1 Tax=Streptomyces sp. NPDC005209 TaxID=3156715 RepID=UPI0033B767A0